MTLSEKIGDFAKATGTTKDEIAKSIGISRSSFFSKIRGEYEFTITEAYKLSTMLDMTVDEFYDLHQEVS